MTERTDVLVVGGGPAGLAAAGEAAKAGLGVVVVDENAKPGGQIYRQPPGKFRSEGGTTEEGRSLIDEIQRLPVRFLQEATVWGQFDPGVLEVAHQAENLRIQARAVVVAVGANDRPASIPGWTLPGVVTAGGAQAMLKSQRILPGRRILLAGAGPLQLVVASQFAKAGVDVVAVTEAVPGPAHLRHAFGLAWGGPTLLDGLRYKLAIRKAGIPWIAPAILTRIEGSERVEAAVVAGVDRDWRPVEGTERVLEVDAVCLGYGLVPSVEIARLLGCRLRYEPVGDAWVPVRDENCETTVPDVFTVGDGAGVAGVKVAVEEGRLAGLVIASRLGSRVDEAKGARRISGVRRRLRRLKRFASAVNQIYTPGSGFYELADAGTEICRCEEVTLEQLDASLAAEARDLAQLKAWTRVGMGPCQGKMCGAAVAQLVSRRTGRPLPEVGLFSVRPPVRSVPLRAVLPPAREGESAPGLDPGEGS